MPGRVHVRIRVHAFVPATKCDDENAPDTFSLLKLITRVCSFMVGRALAKEVEEFHQRTNTNCQSA